MSVNVSVNIVTRTSKGITDTESITDTFVSHVCTSHITNITFYNNHLLRFFVTTTRYLC